MSRFYGTITGCAETSATRRGTNNSGIRASAQSFDGSIIVNLDDNNDTTLVRIGTSKTSSTCSDWSSPEFRGTFAEFNELLNLHQQLKRGEVKIIKQRKK